MHAQLTANLQRAGLAEISTILGRSGLESPIAPFDINLIIPGCGAENTAALEAHGLLPSTVDTIVTVKVLCSVPAIQETCKSLYALLKPGGKWLVYEHIGADPRYWASRWLQEVYQLLWPLVMGGCNINRDTADILRGVGSWESVTLGRMRRDVGWEMFGHVVGTLVKR